VRLEGMLLIIAVPTKFTNVVLREGDELRYKTPAGAGFGDPSATRRRSARTSQKAG
jgi:N-methylhydantoinase B/oxoprolinase/acetone carboxylase alpha subunit